MPPAALRVSRNGEDFVFDTHLSPSDLPAGLQGASGRDICAGKLSNNSRWINGEIALRSIRLAKLAARLRAPWFFEAAASLFPRDYRYYSNVFRVVGIVPGFTIRGQRRTSQSLRDGN